MSRSRTMGSSHLICSVIGVLVQLLKSPGFSEAALPIDVPLSGTAVQSSTFGGNSGAGTAIDGSCSPVWSVSCSHTVETANPWWRLELPEVYRVAVIEVTNRDVRTSRLNDVQILIGNSLVNNGNDNPRCAILYDVPGFRSQTIHCRGMEGKYINFYKPGPSEILTLCEVKVYGELAPPPPSISMEAMGRNVTLVGKRLCWSDALLYCRDFQWDLLSLVGPEEQEMIDELVARAPFPLTSHLWVGLRRSLLGSSWFWMSGDEMDYTNWDPATKGSSHCGGMSIMEPSKWMPRYCGEHLNFICLTDPPEGVKPVPFRSSARVRPTCTN